MWDFPCFATCYLDDLAFVRRIHSTAGDLFFRGNAQACVEIKNSVNRTRVVDVVGGDS